MSEKNSTEVSEEETLGERIRTLRENCGLSQSQLAARVGVIRGYIARLEHDRQRPSAELLWLISRQLGVTMDFLWSGR